MSFEATIRTYLREYQNEYKAALRGGEHTPELSFRVPMHKMFESIAKDLNPTVNCDVILEPRNQGRMGRPDWRIHDKISLGVFGFIEAKSFSENRFDIAPYQKQIKRYLAIGHKLIITDGIDFVFCFTHNPKIVSIIDKSKLNVSDWSLLSINSNFKYHMEQFFSKPIPQRINEEKLIGLIAVRTRILADDIYEFADLSVDVAKNDEERQIIKLLCGLKAVVYNHNDQNFRTEKVFADFTAQIIMFCLLYAHRVFCSSSDTPLVKSQKIRDYAFKNIIEGEDLLPFRNLMVYLRDNSGLSTFIGQWVDECILFLSFVQMTDYQIVNPDYHHLYELFLNKFDKKMRSRYGAFYTPKLLAEFVVRLVDKIATAQFDDKGIYNNGNTIIDPCCGTGSFLEQIVENDNSDYVYNLCGFEILPAPYMLANYRMALVKSRCPDRKQELHIILTNTLSNYLLGDDADANSIEGRESIRAKNLTSRPLKLIIGNPPSSNSKKVNDSGEFRQIIEMMDDFRPPIECRHARQNTQKQVTNPFMQFLRWSCQKLSKSNTHSILAFIVPLSFLENESYQYARKYLIEYFADVWIIAIDADVRAKSRGENLFKVQQGRAVIVLTKKYGEARSIRNFNYIDISKVDKEEKESFLSRDINKVMGCFKSYPVNNNTYSFVPPRYFDRNLYMKFWPISATSENLGVFQKQCSGAKMAPTALLTHVNAFMLKRRSQEIEKKGIVCAHEWIDGQDKSVVDEKIKAFCDALGSLTKRKKLVSVLEDYIRPCSFRPFVNSNAILCKTVFEFQAGVGGSGARDRPEIKAIYDSPETIGFSLAHAPKDLDEKLERFTSFCWYFPDNDLSRRGNAHIYLNQYIGDKKKKQPDNNINQSLLNFFSNLTGISSFDCARKMVFYSYAIFCSRVYLEEFYGALYVVNQTENRARIPMVRDSGKFLLLAEFGEQLATLEKNNVAVENILQLNYDDLLNQIHSGFRLDHSWSSFQSPYDEENELLIIRDVNKQEDTVKIYCPVALQQFTIAGYNVIKDCWLKFHSYRYTHCDFSKNEFKELLDLLNKMAKQIQIISEIDKIVKDIVKGNIPLLNYNDFQ
ncbi:MAG: N-6 DNA methylase [Fibrobacter sp.]|nr:N-6 DNA methylase [Fibrobacter sp.]